MTYKNKFQDINIQLWKLGTTSILRNLSSLYCFQYQFQEFPLTSYFITLGFSYSSNIDSFLSKKILFPVAVIFFFIFNNRFIEIKFTYHKTHFFKVYNSAVFSIEPQSIQTITPISEHFHYVKRTPMSISSHSLTPLSSQSLDHHYSAFCL